MDMVLGHCCGPLLFDDPASGDSVCTECGLVVHRDNSLNNNTTDSFNTTSMMDTTTENPLVYRMVEDLELEPVQEWCRTIVYTLTCLKIKLTNINIGSTIVSLLQERHASYDAVLAYMTMRFGVSMEGKVLHNVDTVADKIRDMDMHNTHCMYHTGILKLGQIISLDFSARRRLLDRCRAAVEKHPLLQFRLPASVVLAAVFVDKEFNINATQYQRVCRHMDIKPASVKKVMLLI